MPLHLGTSGWQYRDWRGVLYPAGVPQGRWLEEYARHFATVESNASFYRLPEATTFADWRDRTPTDFVMAVKASRYLTHVKRLRDPGEPVRRLMTRAAHLGPRLGPVLLQLPPPSPRTPPCWTPAWAASPPEPGLPWNRATPPGGPRRSARCWSAAAPHCAGRTAAPGP